MTTPVKILAGLVVLLALSVALVGFTLLRGQHHALSVAYTTCTARNEAIVVSNERWAKVAKAWATAAEARRASALIESDPRQRHIDLDSAQVYQDVSDSIEPYVPIDCGAKP